MGAGNSTPSPTLPFPPSWLPDEADESAVAAAQASISAISSMPVEHFLSAANFSNVALLPELQRENWLRAWEGGDTAIDFKMHAAVAVQHDPALNKLAYRCVPRRCDEAEFWFCYYTLVHQMLTQQQNLRAVAPPTEAELQIAQEAEEQTESVEAMVARYDAEILEPLRAEVAKLQAEYKQHLATSTNKPGRRQTSEQHQRLARAYRKALEDAEAQLEEAREGLREHMAIMQRSHRKGRAWAQ